MYTKYSKYSETKKKVFSREQKIKCFFLYVLEFLSSKNKLSTEKDLSGRKPIS